MSADLDVDSATSRDSVVIARFASLCVDTTVVSSCCFRSAASLAVSRGPFSKVAAVTESLYNHKVRVGSTLPGRPGEAVTCVRAAVGVEER